MFAELLAFVMAYVGEGDAAFGTLEVVVFHVAGEVDVGLLADGVVDEETACSTTDCHAADGGGDNVADTQDGKAKGHLHLLEE